MLMSGSPSTVGSTFSTVPMSPTVGSMSPSSTPSSGGDGIPSYEDTCNFKCNTGYELTGSPQRTCQSDGSWSGSPLSCTIMECPSSSLPMSSMLAESCSSTYQSMCDLQFKEGFSGKGDPSHVCDVEGTSVKWRSVGGSFDCAATTRSGGGGSDGIVYAVAGAAAGGSAVFIALTLLCILVLVVRWSYKRRANNESVNDSAAKPNKNYDYVELDTSPCDTTSAIKMDYNPSYGITDKDGNAVKMDSNPSYNATDLSYDAAKLERTSEDHCSYVKLCPFIERTPSRWRPILHISQPQETVQLINNNCYITIVIVTD
ncbi:uncharacterized protein [Dysidea avara]|uniref:uncharacterized protein isoform X2 n=1 Tax=Dysidea avara TaxID=196820 RepID=UPI003328B718